MPDFSRSLREVGLSPTMEIRRIHGSSVTGTEAEHTWTAIRKPPLLAKNARNGARRTVQSMSIALIGDVGLSAELRSAGGQRPATWPVALSLIADS